MELDYFQFMAQRVNRLDGVLHWATPAAWTTKVTTPEAHAGGRFLAAGGTRRRPGAVQGVSQILVPRQP